MAIHTTREVTLASSATRTASDNGDWFNIEDTLEGIVYIDVTAEVGAITLTVYVDSWYDGGDNAKYISNWNSGAITGTGYYPVFLTNYGKWIRARWTISGTTSMTFSVTFNGKS